MTFQTLGKLPWTAVFGPAWPLGVTLSAVLALVSLFLAMVSLGGNGLNPVLPTLTTVLMGGTLVFAAWTGVSRQGMLRRRWTDRVAPSHAVKRLDWACALGLGLTWVASLTVAAPWMLVQSQIDAPALAYVSALSAAFSGTVVLAAAWQGRLPALLLALVLLVPAFVAKGGWLAIWPVWVQAPVEFHAATVLAALPLTLAVLTVSPPPFRTAPAALIAKAWRRWRDTWRRRHVPVLGVNRNPGAALAIVFVGLPLRFFAESWNFTDVLLGALGQAWMLAIAYNGLLSQDLHWRMHLAPGHARQRVGWRMVQTTLQSHLLGATFWFGLTSLFLVVVSPSAARHWGMDAADLIPTLVVKWTLAVMACVWLRGLQASFAERFTLGLSIALGTVLVAWGMARVLGPLPTGVPSALATLLVAALLYRPIRTAWARCDLSEFMPRATAGD